jgi:hypothetical protein
MAGQSSNIGANPTTAANVDFGAIMNQNLDRLALNQERDRLAAEREAKRNQEFEDKYGINEDQYVLEDTQFRDINDAATEAVSLLRDRRWKVYQELKQNPSDENKKRLGKIDNSVKKLSASNQKMAELSETFVTMLENDEISGVDEDRIRNMIESVERGDIKVHLDNDDNMSYLFYDKNKKLQDVTSFGDLMKESPTKRIDLDTELDAIVKAVGTDDIDTVNGRYIKSSNVFGEDQARFVNGEIDAFLGTDERSLEVNPTLADLLNQATGGSSKKTKNFTEDERQFVKNYLLQQTKDRYSESIKLKERQQPRAQSAADAKKPKAADINIAFQGSQPTRDSEGNFVFTISKPVAVDPTKSDRKIDTIKSDSQGNIIVEGEDSFLVG